MEKQKIFDWILKIVLIFGGTIFITIVIIMLASIFAKEEPEPPKVSPDDFSFREYNWGLRVFAPECENTYNCRNLEYSYICKEIAFFPLYLDIYFDGKKIDTLLKCRDIRGYSPDIHKILYVDASKTHILKICFSRKIDSDKLVNPLCDSITIQPFLCKDYGEECRGYWTSEGLTNDCCNKDTDGYDLVCAKYHPPYPGYDSGYFAPIELNNEEGICKRREELFEGWYRFSYTP